MKDYVQIKMSYLVYVLVFVVVFAAGFFASRMAITGKFIDATSEENCKAFCPLVNMEYAFVKDGNCYCNQKQYLYNQNENETTTIVQTVNYGIIKSIDVEEGLTEEARNILVQQIQQQLRSQQTQQVT